MPGLLIPVKNTPVPALLRYSHGNLRSCTAPTAQERVTRPLPRSVAPRSKSTATTCKASSATENYKTGQDFLTVASKASPFKDAGATVLTDLFNKGQEETLPAGYKLSEAGAAPTACHLLLHSCFLRSNGEGKSSLALHLWLMLRNQHCPWQISAAGYHKPRILMPQSILYCSFSSKSWQGCQPERAVAR